MTGSAAACCRFAKIYSRFSDLEFRGAPDPPRRIRVSRKGFEPPLGGLLRFVAQSFRAGRRLCAARFVAPSLRAGRWASAFLLCCLMASAVIAAPTLRAVEFEGHHYFSPRRLLSFTDLRVGQDFNEQLLEAAAAKLLQNMSAEGFYFCHVDSIAQNWDADSARVGLTFFITQLCEYQ